MSGRDIPTALALRKARELWKRLGGSVEDVPRTGEERYSHPDLQRSIKVNKRRKDAPRKLVSALRHLVDDGHGDDMRRVA